MEPGKISNGIRWLLELTGLPDNYINNLWILAAILIIAIISLFAYYITKNILIKLLTVYVNHTKNEIDDILLEKKVFNRLAHLAPIIIIYFGAKYAFAGYPKIVIFIHESLFVITIIIVSRVVISFFNSINEIFSKSTLANGRPIKGYIQLANIIVVIISILLIYSSISGNSINGVLTGLGAMAAVLMLIFKDTILGLTASIQLSANNMVKIGDWITMPSHNAEGTVTEITLNTVKIQNGDKTISTIPTYLLVSESFNNFSGVVETGGRRIKRSINIDMYTILFCNAQMLEEFYKIELLKPFFDEIKTNHNPETINQLTNITVFRKYVELYLLSHPKIRKDLTLVVRHLQPTDKGIPVEIYAFANETSLAKFESIQSEIFDHLLAKIPLFSLRVFQSALSL